MAQQTKPAKLPVIDPDSVAEALCDGRFHIHPHGNLATITFTHTRPIVGDLFDGRGNFEEVVRARITMTLNNFVALRNLLNDVIKDGGNQIPVGGASSPTKH